MRSLRGVRFVPGAFSRLGASTVKGRIGFLQEFDAAAQGDSDAALNLPIGKNFAGAGVGQGVAGGALPIGKTLGGAAAGAGTAAGNVSATSPSGTLPALGSLAFYVNATLDDYARLLSIPSAFGTGEFTFEFRCKLDESYPVGTAGGTSTTNWSSADPTRYSSSSWWYAGNFLLDGHNNTDVRLGTFSVQVIGGGRLRWSFGDNTQLLSNGGLLAVQPVPASSSPSLLDDKWHHVALVRRWSGASSATLEMWIDGVLVASETSPARTNMQTYWATWGGYGGGIQNGWMFGAEKFSAGGGAYWDDYKGLLSYVRFYSRAKTATELANDWAPDSTASETGLVGLFRMGALSSNRTYDAIRPAEYIECTPRANPAHVTEIPTIVVMPNIAFTSGTAGSVNLATGARTGTVSPAAGSYIAGYNATQHVVQRVTGSPAFQSGVSLSSGGVLTYDGAGAIATVNNAQIEVVPSADADWLARSTASGVRYADNFETVWGYRSGDTMPRYDRPNEANPIRAFKDTAIRCSGTGSLRFDLLDAMADTAGTYFLPISPLFGENSTFYVQFRLRVNAATLVDRNGNGNKFAVLQYGQTCSDMEISLQHTYYRGFPHIYVGCGGNGIERTSGSTIYMQQGSDFPTGGGWNCPYPTFPTGSCSYFVPDQWMTLYFRIQVGTWGDANSNIQAWVSRFPGDPLQQFINGPNWTIPNTPPVFPGYDRLSFSVYDTNNTIATPGASIWFDEAIVSANPIAAPVALPISG